MDGVLKQVYRFRGFILAIGVVLLLTAVYAGILPWRYTAANNGGDSGDLLSAVLTGGVPHPSGYPLYLLFARIIQFLPFGSPVWRGSLVSFIPAILSAAGLAWLTMQIVGQRWLGFVSGLLVGLSLAGSALFMSQAVIVEVYGLQTFFTTAFLFWFWVCLRQPTNQFTWVKMSLALLCGLGLGNHLTIVFLVPVFFLGLWFLRKQSEKYTQLWIYLGLFLAGSSLYLYLPWLASHHSPVNWGDAETVDGLVWLVTGHLYQGNILNLSLPQIAGRISALAGILLKNFGILGLAAGVFGAWWWDVKDTFARVCMYVAAIYALFSIIYSTNDSMVYLLPVLMIFSLWAGLSVIYFWQVSRGKFYWGRWLLLIIFFCGAYQVYQTRQVIDPRQEHTAADFAESYLQSSPKDAILLTSADGDTFPLWYYHYGLNWRPDLQLVSLGLLQFEWYRQNLTYTNPLLKIEPFTNQADEAWLSRLSEQNDDVTVCRSWLIDKRIQFQCYPFTK